MGKRPVCTYKYEEADKYVTLNDNDPDLTPVVLRLPSPPDERLIEGWGLPAEKQKFKRLEIPDGLRRIEKQAVDELNSVNANNANKVVTLYKIQKKFWQIIESDFKKYEAEIAFLKRFWWHRINGFWFYNRGKPTYISGWHFFYLNVWTMNTDDGSYMPEYRDRDRKEFLFKLYAYTATETFKHIDKDGIAVPNEDGSYTMTDLGRRICYGVGQSKNRRSGNTNKGLSDCTEIVMRSMLNDGMVIFSHTGSDAQKHFNQKMMPGFAKLPIWIKPLTTSGQTASSIKFEQEKNDYGTEGLRTKICAAEEGGDKAVDGQKLVAVILDESGKVQRHDVTQRWKTIKACLAQGNGRIIRGWSYHPSTVEEMSSGGAEYRILLQSSNFYKRFPNGQTRSGLFRIFVPADEGLDGFIDDWGFSVKDKIEPWQEGKFTETAHDSLQSELDALLNEGSPEAMMDYRHQKKLFPLKYADSWLGATGELGFPLEKIDQRQAILRRSDFIEVGNLKWVDDKFGGDVYFEEDKIAGRFEISARPPVAVMNQKSTIEFYSVFEQKVVNMFQPRFPNRGVVGADPFRFRNERNDIKSKIEKGEKQSRLSKGGITGLECKYPSDDGKPMSEWEGYRFTLSYSFRSNSDDFNEDLLKAAIWAGYMVYPETNVGNIEEYFIRNKFGGYLIYDIDQHTGQKKKSPGVHNIDTSKQRLFSLTKTYLEYRVHVECHSSYLTECQQIKSIEAMTMYDRFASAGLALLGAESLYPSRATATEEQGDDLGSFVEEYYY